MRKVLENSLKCGSVGLSDEVKEEAKRRKLDPENRKDLQNVGDALRKEKGGDYLAEVAIKKSETLENDIIVFDGIRNTLEVKAFRKLPQFYLIALDCSKDNRWERLREKYHNDINLFEIDDLRDQNEGLLYGQEVVRCVEEADIHFINEENYPNKLKIAEELNERFKLYVDLILQTKLRNPSLDETIMTVAATLALQSNCIKRRVGAVLCDSQGYVISGAYNEVPKGQDECLKEYRQCYRQIIKQQILDQITKNYKRCPYCGNEQAFDNGNYTCNKCQTDLSQVTSHFRALDKCRSLHAEETTILKAAQYQINGSYLYTTTFPCMQCSKRILQAGIKNVIYIDPYPEKESIIMLEKGGVTTKKFEGVKAQAYYKLFYSFQKSLEEQIDEKLKHV